MQLDSATQTLKPDKERGITIISPEKITLLQLPAEIRFHILEYIDRAGTISLNIQGRNDIQVESRNPSWPLLATCRRLREEFMVRPFTIQLTITVPQPYTHALHDKSLDIANIICERIPLKVRSLISSLHIRADVRNLPLDSLDILSHLQRLVLRNVTVSSRHLVTFRIHPIAISDSIGLGNHSCLFDREVELSELNERQFWHLNREFLQKNPCLTERKIKVYVMGRGVKDRTTSKRAAVNLIPA